MQNNFRNLTIFIYISERIETKTGDTYNKKGRTMSVPYPLNFNQSDDLHNVST